MSILGVPLLSVALAGIAAWLLGAVWYAVFGKAWSETLGDPSLRKPDPGTLAFSFVADCVLALFIGVVTAIATTGHGGVRMGLAIAAVLWFCCVFTTLAVTHAYARRGTRLTLIDAGHWLAAMLAAGAVIGWLPME